MEVQLAVQFQQLLPRGRDWNNWIDKLAKIAVDIVLHFLQGLNIPCLRASRVLERADMPSTVRIPLKQLVKVPCRASLAELNFATRIGVHLMSSSACIALSDRGGLREYSGRQILNSGDQRCCTMLRRRDFADVDWKLLLWHIWENKNNDRREKLALGRLSGGWR